MKRSVIFLCITVSLLLTGCANNKLVLNPNEEDRSRREQQLLIEENEISSTTLNQIEPSSSQENQDELETEEESDVNVEEETFEENEEEQAEELFPIIEVIDGDTFRVEINGTVKTVRLIGVDTPETVHPTKKVQCFGKEASNFTKGLLTNQFVFLETDSQSDTIDKYGRLLRYAYLPDGLFINALLIEKGYAYAYTRFPFDYLDKFVILENEAREQEVGLWGDGGC